MSRSANHYFTGASGSTPNYIEDVFSTYLWTGNGSTQTITNNIDLSTKGGMVWIKSRSNTYAHRVFDTTRGATKFLATDAVGAEDTNASSLTAFTSSGFSVGASTAVNDNAATYCAWTFRKQPKFFDIVTYTGSGSSQTINHNLGSTPGMIIIKMTSGAEDWYVYHRSLTTGRLRLNSTSAEFGTPAVTSVTSTSFNVSVNSEVNNDGGRTYVAYLFAHNAGGFGLAGTDNVISCGSFSTDASGGYSVNLGYEAQYVLLKRINASGNWSIVDIMRGAAVSANTTRELNADLVAAESTNSVLMSPSATGFFASSTLSNLSSGDYIYMAIRRGPMKVPTSGTSVFEPVAYTGTGTNNRIITSSITPDSVIPAQRNDTASKYWYDRLRGNGTYLVISGTDAEGAEGGSFGPQFNKVQTGYQQGTIDSGFLNNSTLPTTYINYLLKRAPSFFDEVCYTGTGSARTVTHNLAVVPEMMIVKSRSATQQWSVYTSGVGPTGRMPLQLGNAADYATVYWNDTAPTSSVFTVGSNATVNQSSATHVAYLFATCAGVSKVGSYTGTGTTLQIDCGFTGGARFVLIKRTDSTGDWYVWDTARGIIAGNDPYLLLNSTAAEVTNTDYIDTYSAGFEISSTAPAAINANGGTYIFLAIA